SKTWTLSGSGTPLSIAGGFTGNASTFSYTSGSGVSALASRAMTGSYAFYDLTINGAGTFTAGVDVAVSNDLTVSGGTLGGTNNITINGGDATGNGTINLTGGTFTLDGGGNFGGATAWTFSSLTFGDGSGAATTTAGSSGGMTVSGTLTVANNQGLKAGSLTWTLSGSGTPLAVNGGFDRQTSTFTYTSASGVSALANRAMTGSYAFRNLTINQSGQTFTAGVALEVMGDLTVTAGSLVLGSNNLTTGSSGVANSGSIKVASSQTLNQSSSGMTTIRSSASGSNCIGSDGASCAGTAGTLVFGSLSIGAAASSTAFTTTFGGDAPTTTIDNIFTITANTTFNGSEGVITLTNSGTPFVNNGTFNAQTSTIQYTASSVNISAGTYQDLEFKPSSGNPTYTLGTGASQTITVNHSLVIGDGVNPVTVTAATNNPNIDVNGDVTIASGATFTAPSSGTLNVSRFWTANGTFDHNNGTVIFDGTAAGLAVDGDLDDKAKFYNVIFNGSGGQWSVSTSTIVVNDLTVTAGTLSGTNNVTVNGGDVTGNGAINFNGGTFTLDGAGNFGGSSAWNFSNLTLGDGTGAATTTTTGAGDITVSNTLTVANNQGLDAGPKTWTLTGTNGSPLAINGGFSGNASTLVFTGNNPGGNTAIAASLSYNNLTLDNSSETYTLEGATTLGGDLTITAGILSESTDAMKITGGDVTGEGTISFNGSSAFTLYSPSSFGGGTAWTFNDLTFGDNLAAATSTAVGAGGITVAGILSITDNNGLDAGSKTWTLSGSGTPLSVSGSLSGSNSTFTYISGSGVSALSSRAMTGSYAYNNLTINGSGNFTTGVDVTVSNDLALTSGTLAGTNNITVNGGDVTGSGGINLTGGTFTLDGTGNFGDSSAWTFNNLTFGDGAGSAVTTAGGNGNVTVNATLAIAANQTLKAGPKTWTLSGSGTPLTVTGTLDAESSTIDYTGTSATTITAATYNNLGIKPGANSLTHTLAGGTTAVNGNLTLGNGTNTGVTVTASPNSTTFDLNGSLTISANTTFAANGSNTMTVAGNWTNNGNFTHNSGTVNFDGSGEATISGATTFNHFSSATPGKLLKFQKASGGAPVFTVAGNMTISGIGGVGGKVSLQSDQAGSQWLVHFTGPQSGITGSDIRDSGCNPGSANANVDLSNRDGGNNGSCWIFVPPSRGSGSGATEAGSGGGTPQTGGGGAGSGATEGGSGGGTPQTGGSGGGSGATEGAAIEALPRTGTSFFGAISNFLRRLTGF
ncbi:MAG: hypothetical protein HY396_02725, partial [Candidatus Doudnabacteria bacterium]|nr:hypothetical protein [Candidatus Doudnabacteria bacterium]